MSKRGKFRVPSGNGSSRLASLPHSGLDMASLLKSPSEQSSTSMLLCEGVVGGSDSAGGMDDGIVGGSDSDEGVLARTVCRVGCPLSIIAFFLLVLVMPTLRATCK